MSNPIKLRYYRIVWALIFLVLLIGLLFIYVDYSGLMNETVAESSDLINNQPSLTYKNRQFYLKGRPLQIIAGTIHYFRVHRKYWRTRLLQLKAAGFNTVDTCIPWNLHEKTKGSFNFHGDFNIRKFIKLAQSVGLFVILRPGPFVGSQIDFGGLPGWLLKDANMRVRSMYMGFTLAVDSYFQVLMHQLADLQASASGPVIAMQVEHEYGSYGDSQQYLHFLCGTLRKYGAKEAFFASESVDGFARHRRLDGDFVGINFNRAEEGRKMISNLQAWDRDLPIFVSELWSGSQLTWGALDRTDAIRAKPLAELIDKLLGPMRASLCLHMFHGGTNFGFSAARLVSSSHDWDAPVTEWGSRDTQKYRAVALVVAKATANRSDEATARQRAEAELLGAAGGPSGRVKAYGNFTIESTMDWTELIGLVEDPKLYETAKFMEDVDQSFGFIVYRSAFKSGQVVTVDGYVADWGLLLINSQPPDPGNPTSGVLAGGIPQQHHHQQPVQQPQPAQRHLSLKRASLATGGPSNANDNAEFDQNRNTLDLLVENLGRSAGIGGFIEFNAQRKGLASWHSINAEQLQSPGRILVNDQPLPSYKTYSMRFDAAFLAKASVRRNSWRSFTNLSALNQQPRLYRTTLKLSSEAQLADTFLDMSAWSKGLAFVNGFNLGRYWTQVGPQRTLYVPAPLLRQGDNEIIVFELLRPANYVLFVQAPKFVYPI